MTFFPIRTHFDPLPCSPFTKLVFGFCQKLKCNYGTRLCTKLKIIDKIFLCIITGKPVKSLPELLREYNLPPGLFPNNIISYEFDETKAKLVVYLPSSCELTFKDSSVIRYATRVKAILMRGKLTSIEGMKTKMLVWVKVTNVAVEGYRSDKVWFTAGVKKSRPRCAYETPLDATRVEEF
ncbi:hypothetical protein Hdeb2414_s0005g00173361 [Helianthus debilis subsp. tardiflorus]